MSKFLDVAIEIAREAGTILRRNSTARSRFPTRAKWISSRNPIAAPKRLSSRICENIFRITGSSPKRAASGAAAGAKYCWHVDPLDGTTNFAHGYPCFAVSIGLAEEGEPIAGVVFNPVSDEMFTAARGEGAFLNGKRDPRLAD